MKSCSLGNVVRTTLALAFASVEDFMLPIRDHDVWVWLGDLIPWCSLPVSYTSVKHRSPVLFAAPFGAPGNLDKGLTR